MSLIQALRITNYDLLLSFDADMRDLRVNGSYRPRYPTFGPGASGGEDRPIPRRSKIY